MLTPVVQPMVPDYASARIQAGLMPMNLFACFNPGTGSAQAPPRIITNLRIAHKASRGRAGSVPYT
jgi:hypothetical protein